MCLYLQRAGERAEGVSGALARAVREVNLGRRTTAWSGGRRGGGGRVKGGLGVRGVKERKYDRGGDGK